MSWPADIIRKIVELLEWRTLVAFGQVCKRFNALIKKENVWTKKAFAEFGYVPPPKHFRIEIDYLAQRYSRLYQVYLTKPVSIKEVDATIMQGASEITYHQVILQLPDPSYYRSFPETALLSSDLISCQKDSIVSRDARKFRNWRRNFLVQLRKEMEALSRSIINFIQGSLDFSPIVLPINELQMKKLAALYCGSGHDFEDLSLINQRLYLATYSEQKINLLLFKQNSRIHVYLLQLNKKSPEPYKNGYPRVVNNYLRYKYHLYPRDAQYFFRKK